MKVYIALPVIACRTNCAYDIANGELFNVTSFTKNHIIIKDKDSNTRKIDINDFTKLFYPAYCITAHKSQGATFDRPYTILEWSKMSDRMKYVSISRATNKNLINIIDDAGGLV